MTAAEATARRAVLRVRPERVGSTRWVVACLSLSLLSLAAFGVALTVLSGPDGLPLSLASLAALHLFTLGFLVPVALAAATQLAAALFLPAAERRSGRLLVLVWAAGVGVALGFARLGPILPAAGAALLAAAMGTVAAIARRLGRGAPATLSLRLGMLGGLAGLALTLVAGLVAALALVGALPLTPPVGLHVSLAGSAAFVPLVLAVSTQVFPMFARCPPAPTAALRSGPALASLVGATALCLGVATHLRPAVDAGAAIEAAAVAVWFAVQERQYRRRQGPRRDPAAWGARLAAAVLVLGAGLGVAHLALGLGGEGTTPAALSLVLLGGVGGSVVAYLRRILPFSVWHGLHQRLGRAWTLPRLDALRPGLAVEVLPVLWACATVLVAWSLTGIGAGPVAHVVRGHAYWPLAAAALLGALELGWAPAVGIGVLLRARSAGHGPGGPTTA